MLVLLIALSLFIDRGNEPDSSNAISNGAGPDASQESSGGTGHDSSQPPSGGAGLGAPNTRHPSIMVGDTYFFLSGASIDADIAESDYLGMVTSTVPLTEIPTIDGQSNFVAEGTPYAAHPDGIIVLIEGRWVIFQTWDDVMVSQYVDH